MPAGGGGCRPSPGRGTSRQSVDLRNGRAVRPPHPGNVVGRRRTGRRDATFGALWDPGLLWWTHLTSTRGMLRRTHLARSGTRRRVAFISTGDRLGGAHLTRTGGVHRGTYLTTTGDMRRWTRLTRTGGVHRRTQLTITGDMRRGAHLTSTGGMLRRTHLTIGGMLRGTHLTTSASVRRQTGAPRRSVGQADDGLPGRLHTRARHSHGRCGRDRRRRGCAPSSRGIRGRRALDRRGLRLVDHDLRRVDHRFRARRRHLIHRHRARLARARQLTCSLLRHGRWRTRGRGLIPRPRRGGAAGEEQHCDQRQPAGHDQ